MNRIYSTSLFTVDVRHGRRDTHLVLDFFVPKIYTSEIPNTMPVLKRLLPSIYKSQCFNEGNLTFREEVKDTEIGHLFEHILLEFLCITKLKRGFDCSEYSGVTNWNWKKERKGKFHVKIDLGIGDCEIFKEAVEKSISLMNLILMGSMDTTYETNTVPAVAGT
ncbi:MAG TPA: hypothetical protein VF185_02815, partial [Patescibacteria group bacterium]